MSIHKAMPKNALFFTQLPNSEGYTDITVEGLGLKVGEVHLLDVRRPDEWTGELGHIDGSYFATLESEFAGFLDSVPPELRDETWVFVCKSGGRSGRAAAIATQKGFSRAYNMMGGMLRWNALGLPTAKKLPDGLA